MTTSSQPSVLNIYGCWNRNTSMVYNSLDYTSMAYYKQLGLFDKKHKHFFFVNEKEKQNTWTVNENLNHIYEVV